MDCPLYERIMKVSALGSLRQEGRNVREFAQDFFFTSEGLGLGKIALKDLFNYALDKPFVVSEMEVLRAFDFC